MIGAYNDNTGDDYAGAAYLFNTNGALLTTFTNPAPAYGDNFGFSVAAVGNDRVLIGAVSDNMVYNFSGTAYLFGTNGVLLTTFTNPTPASGEGFGCSVAAVGIDRVLIGASGEETYVYQGGAAYLFNTNGVLLTIFTNPTPAESDTFGWSVAAVEADRVLIGAPWDDTSATDAGVAYLFSTNGALLATFTNPTPAVGDLFGVSVAAVGADRVLIGANEDDTGALDAGAAYLFNTNGALLNTFTNPTPDVFDRFGNSVAVVGAAQVVIGASGDNTGDTYAGAAYLFSEIVPILTIRRTITNTLAVSWSSSLTGWMLQQNTNSVGLANWSNVIGTVQNDGATKTVIVNSSPGNRFYRLFKP